jgi:putative membrane protein
MRSFLLRVLVNGAAIWVAAAVVPGVELGEGSTTDTILTVLLVGLIFGVVNALVKPFVKLVTLPLYILTLGLFSLVVNALLLWLTSWLSGRLDLAFGVDGFWAAVLGGLVVSIVSVVLDALLPD